MVDLVNMMESLIGLVCVVLGGIGAAWGLMHPAPSLFLWFREKVLAPVFRGLRLDSALRCLGCLSFWTTGVLTVIWLWAGSWEWMLPLLPAGLMALGSRGVSYVWGRPMLPSTGSSPSPYSLRAGSGGPSGLVSTGAAEANAAQTDRAGHGAADTPCCG